ncbi:MAG: succinate dehydrogenase/fumarate reductase iron-sulfur subunit [Polyangiaceae bacterium]|nr:succinate dehydrogenase/fumarate reductase iron-sulfur subunit [Polyangiaceae bacterium]
MSDTTFKMTLHVWRQTGQGQGGFKAYTVDEVNEHMSFLEMLDVLNERLIAAGDDPIAFDHDCREGICGACGIVVNGIPHGPQRRTTTCQLHMRQFKNGPFEVWLEPWRASGFPVVKDLVVDRGALDRIIAAGGYVTVRTGSAPEANDKLISKKIADRAMDAAECIGCGACVAACPNASASLFTAAKIAHLNLLPQGEPERDDRARKMVAQAEAEGFGGCTNHNECEAACPKGISVAFIAQMNRDTLKALITAKDDISARQGGG